MIPVLLSLPDRGSPKLGQPYSAGPPPGPRSLPKGQIAGDLIARVQVSRPARDSCRLSPSLGSRQALKLALCCCFVAVLVVVLLLLVLCFRLGLHLPAAVAPSRGLHRARTKPQTAKRIRAGAALCEVCSGVATEIR